MKINLLKTIWNLIKFYDAMNIFTIIMFANMLLVDILYVFQDEASIHIIYPIVGMFGFVFCIFAMWWICVPYKNEWIVYNSKNEIG